MTRSIRRFRGHSYPHDQRLQAWRTFLAEIGLKAVQGGTEAAVDSADAIGLARVEAGSVALWRLHAAGQVLTPLGARMRAPLLLLPLNGSVGVAGEGGPITVHQGELGLVPQDQGWQLRFGQHGRALGLLLPDEALLGRRSANTSLTQARIYQAEGMAAVLAGMIETVGAGLESFQAADWRALGTTLADLFFALPAKPPSDGTQRLASAGLLGRVTQLIEANLAEHDLTAERVAKLEGISERYLQRLFEQNGETFKHYLRERRLMRAQAMLSAPGEMELSAAGVAFSCGFDDAANFSRQFKQRFGLPPGAWRARLLEQLREDPAEVEHRGWPVAALSSARARGRQSSGPSDGQRSPADRSPKDGAPGTLHRLRVSAETIHWGYFSRSLTPVAKIRSGDSIEIETLSQHASDAPELMIAGDPAAEDIFFWDGTRKTVDRRGAGPIDASIFGRGAGEGFGVHICTGPIEIEGALPGDVVEVRIDDIVPRPSQAPGYEGRFFGSNVAAWWGYHYGELLNEPKPRETVTIFEVHPDAEGDGYAEIVHSYRWTARRDPFGVLHRTYDYPGVLVDAASVEQKAPPLPPVRIPLRPHFGVIALAPRETELIDSVPPAYFGGNIDNWRLGRGTSIFLPVSVKGGLLSVGDPHAAQGDGELDGTAIECSMTGRFKVRLHKRGTAIADITYPLIETPDAWILTGFSHPDYLAEFGAKGQSEVYAKSSLDLAMRDAFRKARRFVMARAQLDEDQAVALISVGVDFGVTQVVDGNWGIHAIIPKSIFGRQEEDGQET